jgi:NitT/TauT family transport system substrate-binding protein
MSDHRLQTQLTRRALLSAGAGLLATAGLAACDGDDPKGIIVTPENDALIPAVVPISLKLANSNSMADAPFLVALERGLFSAETLEPELELRTDDAELIELLTTGGADIVLGALGPAFFNALQSGHDLKLVGPLATDVQPLSIPLMASRERVDAGALTATADLAGATLGIAQAGFHEYLLWKALAAGGLTLDDVEIEITSGRRLRTRLERGLIDAALIAEPEATAAVVAGQAVVLDETYLPGYTAAYALTTAAFLETQADTVSRFFRVLYTGCVEMLRDGFNAPRNQNIFQLYTGADTAILAQMRPYGCGDDGAVNASAVEELQRFYLDRGMLNLTTAIDANSFIDDRLAREAAAATFED